MSTDHNDQLDEGLTPRYDVQRLNDPEGKHDDCRYFVLDPRHDSYARSVLAVYAQEVDNAGYKKLAAEIMGWLHELDDEKGNA